MIPKIIHYCWLSNDPYPESIQRCINSWKIHLPDYKLLLWNFQRFPRGKSKWVDQAFDSHKYAFAADYIRLYALYNYGGIYLDSDVEVLKSFDDLLDLPYFIGQENTSSGIEAATIGCEKGNVLIKDIFDSFKDKVFINSDGSFNTLPLPFTFRKCIEARYTYHCITCKEQFDRSDNVINVFPLDWFSPKHWQTKELLLTNNTYSIHHFEGSWLEKKQEGSEKKKETKDNIKKGSHSCISLVRIKIALLCRKIAFRNKYFAKIYFRLYRREIFQLNSSLLIYKPDYRQIAKLKVPFVKCEVEFILREKSKHKDKINDFSPIMRVKGTQIEIHPYYCNMYSIFTKKRCLELVRDV